MPTHRTKPSPVSQALRRHRVAILATLLVLGLAYVAIPQLGFFGSNWDTLLQSDWRLVVAAIGVLLTSFAAAAFIYKQLTFRPLAFGPTYLVQVAGSFAGRVLPAGLGSISVNYLYLRKQGHKSANAATIVALNNLLGIVGHSLWLGIVALVWTGQITFHLPHAVPGWVYLAVGAGLVGIVLLVIIVRRRWQRMIRDITKQFAAYRDKPARLLRGLVASMLLTACYITIVWLSAHALEITLDWVGAAVTLTVGMLAQTVTPTPGGLGGVEAGLAAGLVVSGLALEDAVVVTILYRFITFWVPLVLGGMAFAVAIRRKLL